MVLFACKLQGSHLRIAARLTDTSYGKMAWQMGFLGKWREKGRAKREVVLSLKLKANDRESWAFEGSGRCGRESHSAVVLAGFNGCGATNQGAHRWRLAWSSLQVVLTGGPHRWSSLRCAALHLHVQITIDAVWLEGATGQAPASHLAQG